MLRNLIVSLTAWAYDKPLKSLSIVLGLSVFLALGLGNLQIDSSNEGLFQPDDPVLQSYRSFQRQFGRNDAVIAAISSEQIFSGEFMQKLREFHHDLEESVPWLDDVTSLVNVDWMVAMPDGSLKVAKLGDEWPVYHDVPPALREEILASPLYRNTLVSGDAQMTLVVIRALAFSPAVSAYNEVEQVAVEDGFFQDQLLPVKKTPVFNDDEVTNSLKGSQLKEFVIAVEQVANKHRENGLEIRLAGGLLLDKLHHDAIHSDVITLVLAALLIILVALFVLFRTKTAVFLPMFVILLALLSILGLMGWVSVPMTAVAQALPPILLMAGVLDSVHVLGLYYANRRQGDDARAAIINAMDHSGMAVLFTSLTTAAGFLAFTVARMKPIADFGWLAAISVMMVFVYTLLLLPAFIRLRPGQTQTTVQTSFQKYFAVSLQSLANIGVHYPRRVLVSVGLLVVLAAPGIMKTSFSYDVLSWFPEDTPIRVDTLIIDEKFRAIVPLEIIVDSGEENGILTPEFMQRLRTFQDYAESLHDGPASVGRATSIVDSIQRIHSQLSADDIHSIPQNINLLHQEALLYESGGAREIERLVDRSYSKARITLRLAWADGRDMVPLREEVSSKAGDIFRGVATVEVTGAVDLVATGAIDLIKSMTESYLIAAVTISLMLIILWRSLTLGMLAMIPNFITIYLGVALMGYLGMTMNMITVLLGGIALGLAVDDTVHLINGIQRKIREEQVSLNDAIQQTVAKVGPLLVITSLVLSGGFVMFAFSSMVALSSFGLLLAGIILLALVFDLLVIPAIMVLAAPRWLGASIDSRAQEKMS